ncbi:MAG: hypothetical protein LBS57_05505 [Treponema sp.]|jgi:hypothetical protein|nr:hypothetical protein [Treponema sp.]
MIRSLRNRLPRIIVTVFTVLAVTVSFCLWAMEPLRAAGSVAERIGGGDGRIDSFIPSPVREPALLTNADDPRLTPLRTGFQRIFIPCGTNSAASAFYRPPFGISSNINYRDVKNTILLKLRI